MMKSTILCNNINLKLTRFLKYDYIIITHLHFGKRLQKCVCKSALKQPSNTSMPANTQKLVSYALTTLPVVWVPFDN